MACNVGGIERPIRIVLGVLLIGIGAFAGPRRWEPESRWPSAQSLWSPARSDSVRLGACSGLIPVP